MSQITELVKKYSDAQQKLVKIIGQKHARKTNTYHERRMLQQTNLVLKQLIRDSKVWTNSEIPRQYKKGVRRAIDAYKTMDIKTVSFDKVDKIHNKQIELLINNTNDDFVTANVFIGRNIRDNIRQITLDTIAEAKLTGRSMTQIRADLKNRFINQNITAIETKNGRKINLNSYAETVARSVMTETENVAVIEHVKASGHDLVKMSAHASSCPICAPLQGRVYSITGKTKGYPRLNRAFGGTHANIHPNCKHFLFPYDPSKDKDAEKTKEFSNRSFDIDPRSQKEINNYNNQQKRNQQRNADYKQWQRYKIVMPTETNKTFSGFRKSKRVNSKKYQELESNYRSIRIKGEN